MAYITQKQIKGITYYYAEETEWKNGKSRRKWRKYLGPLSKIIAAVEGAGSAPQPKYAEIFELGCPAAYLHIAEEIKAIQTIDGIINKRNQGLTVGFYLTLAAINRGIDPTSKRSMWSWFQNTILLRRFSEANKDALSSQRFWDNMALIQEDKIHQIWMKLINAVLDKEKIDLSCVSYDGTNFYSFIDSFNMRSSLAKRGKNKQGRRDLRQINYALFCSRKDHLPLYFDIYEGNRHDSKEFEVVIEKFFQAFEHRKPAREGITIVFDKGNNSDKNLRKFIEEAQYHFVGSVKLDDHKDLALISNNDNRFTCFSHPRLEEVKAWRTRKQIYGKELTVVVTFNNNLYTSQVKSINNEINKCLDKLCELSEKLQDHLAGRIKKGKKLTVKSVEQQVSSILSGQHMKKLIETTIMEHNDLPSLTYNLNDKAWSELSDTYLGKNIIITDNHDWSTEDIILAYRSQYIIEHTFKHMKDREIGSWWPMFHWTDQMIRVHGLYCSLSLLLRALIMKKVHEAGIAISMNKLHERLSNMREVINVFNKRKNKSSTQSVVSRVDEVQEQLFKVFEMSQYLSSWGQDQ